MKEHWETGALIFDIMRYHYNIPTEQKNSYKEVYCCNHPVYSNCTLFKKDNKGIAVIQQRYIPSNKHTYWSKIDSWLPAELYSSDKFDDYFEKHAKEAINGLYPTVTIRQMMWGLKMKPLKREPWETVFDKCDF